MKKFVVVLMALGLILAGSGMASAAVLIDRGLPNQYLNNEAGANRSNVTWQTDDGTGFTGDDFTIGTAGQKYRIDSITVWGAQYNPLSDDINNIWLYLGKYDGSLAIASNGSVSGNLNSNPNITHEFVTYPDVDSTAIYVGNGNVEYSIAQTTFSGLNYLVDGGVKYKFGVTGDNYLWWNHASNAALSGTLQQGADDRYLTFTFSDLSLVNVVDSYNNGWDKSSDINVRIEGAPVPIPGAILLLGSGLMGLAGFRKRFQK